MQGTVHEVHTTAALCSPEQAALPPKRPFQIIIWGENSLQDCTAKKRPVRAPLISAIAVDEVALVITNPIDAPANRSALCGKEEGQAAVARAQLIKMVQQF